jgi:hypothetical protein
MGESFLPAVEIDSGDALAGLEQRFLDRLDQHDAGSQPDAWHRAVPVMRHVQQLSLESLVKITFKRSHR